eukprot:scaffold2480_cov65-Phaeocystis_antarctica.AAC.2
MLVLLLGLAVRGVGRCRRKRRLGSSSLVLRSAVLVQGLRRGRSSARPAPATLVRRWVSSWCTLNFMPRARGPPRGGGWPRDAHHRPPRSQRCRRSP